MLKLWCEGPEKLVNLTSLCMLHYSQRKLASSCQGTLAMVRVEPFESPQ